MLDLFYKKIPSPSNALHLKQLPPPSFFLTIYSNYCRPPSFRVCQKSEPATLLNQGTRPDPFFHTFPLLPWLFAPLTAANFAGKTHQNRIPIFSLFWPSFFFFFRPSAPPYLGPTPWVMVFNLPTTLLEVMTSSQ